jgi:hypothetical protein
LPSEELFPVISGENVSLDPVEFICCSVRIGFPNSIIWGFFVSSDFSVACGVPIVNKQETLSLTGALLITKPLDIWDGGVIASSRLKLPPWNRPRCSLLSWWSVRAGIISPTRQAARLSTS